MANPYPNPEPLKLSKISLLGVFGGFYTKRLVPRNHLNRNHLRVPTHHTFTHRPREPLVLTHGVAGPKINPTIGEPPGGM